MQRLLAAALLLVALTAPALGQLGPPPKHPLTDLPPPGSVRTAFYFPEHGDDLQFPAGDEIKVVVGVHNDGPAAYNISAALGSLNSPSDFRIHLQNFSQQAYFASVAPGEEASLEYRFRPDALIPAPREFTVALTLLYADAAGKPHASTFFNRTVQIVEKAKLLDTQLLSVWAVLAALVGGVGYVAYGYLRTLAAFRPVKRRTARKADAAPKALDEDEWVKGSLYEAHKKQRAASASKSRSKKA